MGTMTMKTWMQMAARIRSSTTLAGLRICDAHVHFWTPATHQWLQTAKVAGSDGASDPLQVRYTPTSYLADMRGLEAIYIQANMHVHGGFSPVEEVAWVSGMADGAADVLDVAIVGFADATDPEAFRRVTLECKERYHRYRGVRFMLDYHPTRKELCQTDSGGHMKDSRVLESVRFLGKENLSFDLQVCQCQLPEAAVFVRACPDTQFLLNHAGFPLRGEYEEWTKGMEQLAQASNVSVKIGGLGTYDDTHFDSEETARYVTRILELFGVDRCFFSSNLPVDLLNVPNPLERWSMFLRAVAHLPSEDKEKLFRGNAKKYYNI